MFISVLVHCISVLSLLINLQIETWAHFAL